jgi:hypothetical protein
MAKVDWMWLAQYTVRHGLTANAGLRIAQENGLGVRRATWLQAVSQIRTNNALRAASMESILVGIPSGSGINPLPTSQATGYMQYVSVAVRDKNTGLLSWRDQSLRTDNLLSKEAAIEYLTSRYRSAVDSSKVSPARWGTSPDEVVEGGIYTGTIEFVPMP